MIIFDNYKEYVGYQEQKEGYKTAADGSPLAYILNYNGVWDNDNEPLTPPNTISLTLTSVPVQCALTEFEIVDEVKRIFWEFPETTVDWYRGDKKYHYQIGLGNKILWQTKSPFLVLPKRRAWYHFWFKRNDIREGWNSCQLQKLKVEVARNTRRGVANTQVEDVIYYKGQQPSDAPIIVVKGLNGKFAVIKHPQFEFYGFNITNWEEQYTD